MSPDKCALVLTSSVLVTAPNTFLTDPEERLRQYMDAITFFILESPLSRIIVCDNSGYTYPVLLEELAASKGKKIELLSFSGDREPVLRHGKGYGEGQIMEYVLFHSRLIREAEGFFKVTGRLKVLNIGRLLQRCDAHEVYFMPVSLIRPRFLVPRAARPCVEVRAYYTPIDFFKEVLLDAYKEVSDERVFFLEHAYHRAMVRASSSPSSPGQTTYKIKCFPLAPEITGVSGSNGWTFRERSGWKKALVRLVALLGYIRPLDK